MAARIATSSALPWLRSSVPRSPRSQSVGPRSPIPVPDPRSPGAALRALEQKVLWLAVWMIHHANHLRPKRDGLKVGGHQASSASVVTLMTALYFDVLRPADRVAVKPHASPVFHAIQYLLGRQTREKLERFRAFGGAQSYPSRTKDADDVDFSTGSVGLGVAMTSFAALVQDYLRLKELDGRARARRADDRARSATPSSTRATSSRRCSKAGSTTSANVWWIIDYNRQSLDAVVTDRIFHADGRDLPRHGLARRHAEVRPAARAGVRPARRRRAARLDRRVSELAVLGAGLQGRRGVAASSCVRDLGDTSGIRELLDEHDDERLQASDDQPRRARPRDRARRVPRRARTIGRPVSSPTRSRASACRSPGTRTTTPG